MSKISIFKFRMNSTETIARELINDYLTSKGFELDNEKQIYLMKPKIDKKELILKNVAGAVGSALVGGTYIVSAPYAGSYGFEWSTSNGELIIKAYLYEKNGYKKHITSKFNNAVPARWYNKDLKANLFKTLEEKGFTYIESSVEKIKDGIMSSDAKVLIGLAIFFILLAAIVIFMI